jgi:hypothetical protein
MIIFLSLTTPKDRKSTTFLKEHIINNQKEKTIPLRSL